MEYNRNMNEEEFEKLSPEEQEKVFHHTPFRERQDLLLHSQNPMRLVQSLSREELYLLTQEMDLEERSEVLRYANLPQLFFISDIDCWKKDRLHAKSFLGWLETLLQSDEEKLLAWLVGMDYETVVAGFSYLIRVIKPEWEYPSDELLGDQPFFTLDERYFISVREENIETLRRAVEILFENNRGRYTMILEGILGELEYEIEEEAFQRRAIRLAERGFPDPESARRIYRPLSQEEFDRFPLKNKEKETVPDGAGNGAEAPRHPPMYMTLWSKERLFLDDVLLLFREEAQEIREGLEEELAWLSNKVIACDGIGFASEERVRRGIERARRFVNIGLEKLSARDLDEAKGILKSRWLEAVFRCAVAELFDVREHARKILDKHWPGEDKHFIEFLGEPFGSIFSGILHNIPEHFDPEVKDHADQLRDFKNLEEAGRARRAVLQIESIHGFFTREFASLIPAFNLEARRGLPRRSFVAVLGTLFVSFTLSGQASFRNLSASSLQNFLKTGFENRGGRQLLRAQPKEKFLHHFYSDSEQALLRPLWALVFEKLEEEWKNFNPSRAPDPRFITSIYFSEVNSAEFPRALRHLPAARLPDGQGRDGNKGARGAQRGGTNRTLPNVPGSP